MGKHTELERRELLQNMASSTMLEYSQIKKKYIDQDLTKKLFEKVMTGEWEEVKRLYEENHLAQMQQITKSGHTALHLAVSEEKVEIVKELVEAILDHAYNHKNAELMEALRISDERGRTPLHYVAEIGNVEMCKYIAQADISLVGARNWNRETPLFSAVLYSQREAFRCLNSISTALKEQYTYCWRSDGQTILHCAISGEDFGT